MAKFHFSKKALDDLTSIWDYTVREWSESQAEKYYHLILASCADLAENPQLGKSYDVLAMNILGYKCSQHIIFFHQISKKEIVVERILHGMMDLKNHL
ncbi:type II toxin-antitoxin system RelE/ParE family toxin [Flavobacterium album]|uniref:Toxin n=1 Tax=Flavobacterium album TaxID=2175091 RepID=A0A2S1QZQ3_9FLAO|nr:type II toxin-antitoxin system RelE/ParE family toxin [Flavobacterium album]AWH85845.1 type II toxin-antitoxin system RelE/ParE family toxin [Flavobacterium album]